MADREARQRAIDKASKLASEGPIWVRRALDYKPSDTDSPGERVRQNFWWRVGFTEGIATTLRHTNAGAADVLDEFIKDARSLCAERDQLRSQLSEARGQVARVREWLALNEKSEQPNGPPLSESALEWVRGFNFCREGLLSFLDQPDADKPRDQNSEGEER